MLQQNYITNTKVTAAEARMSLNIYGKDIGTLRGRTIRAQPTQVSVPIIVPWSQKSRPYLWLCASIYSLSMALPSCYLFLAPSPTSLVSFLWKKTLDHIFKRLQLVLQLYGSRGFSISFVFADHEFHSLTKRFLSIGVHLNTAAADEHVPKIERAVCLVKERCRCLLILYMSS